MLFFYSLNKWNAINSLNTVTLWLWAAFTVQRWIIQVKFYESRNTSGCSFPTSVFTEAKFERTVFVLRQLTVKFCLGIKWNKLLLDLHLNLSERQLCYNEKISLFRQTRQVRKTAGNICCYVPCCHKNYETLYCKICLKILRFFV